MGQAVGTEREDPVETRDIDKDLRKGSHYTLYRLSICMLVPIATG